MPPDRSRASLLAEDLEAHATRDELREEFERSRRHDARLARHDLPVIEIDGRLALVVAKRSRRG